MCHLLTRNKWPDSLQHHGRSLINFFCFWVASSNIKRAVTELYTRSGLKRPLVVPVYDEIPMFVIRNNLRILGMTTEEYLEILKQL